MDVLREVFAGLPPEDSVEWGDQLVVIVLVELGNGGVTPPGLEHLDFNVKRVVLFVFPFGVADSMDASSEGLYQTAVAVKSHASQSFSGQGLRDRVVNANV